MANGDELKNILNIAKNINDFKEGIAQLDLNPRERTYFDQQVFPLLDVFNTLSNASQNIADSVHKISLILNKSDVKDVKHLVEGIDSKAEDVFKVLERKVDVLEKIRNSTYL